MSESGGTEMNERSTSRRVGAGGPKESARQGKSEKRTQRVRGKTPPTPESKQLLEEKRFKKMREDVEKRIKEKKDVEGQTWREVFKTSILRNPQGYGEIGETFGRTVAYWRELSDFKGKIERGSEDERNESLRRIGEHSYNAVNLQRSISAIHEYLNLPEYNPNLKVKPDDPKSESALKVIESHFNQVGLENPNNIFEKFADFKISEYIDLRTYVEIAKEDLQRLIDQKNFDRAEIRKAAFGLWRRQQKLAQWRERVIDEAGGITFMHLDLIEGAVNKEIKYSPKKLDHIEKSVEDSDELAEKLESEDGGLSEAENTLKNVLAKDNRFGVDTAYEYTKLPIEDRRDGFAKEFAKNNLVIEKLTEELKKSMSSNPQNVCDLASAIREVRLNNDLLMAEAKWITLREKVGVKNDSILSKLNERFISGRQGIEKFTGDAWEYVSARFKNRRENARLKGIRKREERDREILLKRKKALYKKHTREVMREIRGAKLVSRGKAALRMVPALGGALWDVPRALREEITAGKGMHEILGRARETVGKHWGKEQKRADEEIEEREEKILKESAINPNFRFFTDKLLDSVKRPVPKPVERKGVEGKAKRTEGSTRERQVPVDLPDIDKPEKLNPNAVEARLLAYSFVQKRGEEVVPPLYVLVFKDSDGKYYQQKVGLKGEGLEDEVSDVYNIPDDLTDDIDSVASWFAGKMKDANRKNVAKGLEKNEIVEINTTATFTEERRKAGWKVRSPASGRTERAQGGEKPNTKGTLADLSAEIGNLFKVTEEGEGEQGQEQPEEEQGVVSPPEEEIQEEETTASVFREDEKDLISKTFSEVEVGSFERDLAKVSESSLIKSCVLKLSENHYLLSGEKQIKMDQNWGDNEKIASLHPDVLRVEGLSAMMDRLLSGLNIKVDDLGEAGEMYQELNEHYKKIKKAGDKVAKNMFKGLEENKKKFLVDNLTQRMSTLSMKYNLLRAILSAKYPKEGEENG